MTEIIRPVPTAEQAISSRSVGSSFKPEGRPPAPQDCVMFNESEPREVIVSLMIQKVFEDDDPFNGANDPGLIAAESYSSYVQTLGLTDEASRLRREEANRKFTNIAGFGLAEVIKFENQVRKLHDIETLPF